MKKKLLIITQKVNMDDPILGFFHEWLREFSLYSEVLTVVCLEKGRYDLPSNVKVVSLGKEIKKSRILYLKNFFSCIWKERRNYDSILVHMNYKYVLLAGILWRMLGKKIALWYTHKQVSLGLRLSLLLSHKVFTASKKSFRLDSKKVMVTGHGIDTDLFSPILKERENIFSVISVGRLSPVKDALTLIKAVEILLKEGEKVVVTFVGDAVTPTDNSYVSLLKSYIQDNALNDVVYFKGSISHHELPKFISKADLFVNMSHTGSLDKAVLEAMSCAIPVLTCNEAFFDILAPQGLLFEKKNVEDLSNKIRFVMSTDKREQIAVELRNVVVNNHNLKKLIRLLFNTI